ncbi:cupin domain-containing protein [Pseudonocardia broussonetiae]|uniref:Cupin domain-containing protein n=1 Tax=Pseudonocardia broussonetiae TaxID=2736640 RepID=A0A6M6JKQ2_9PSEU|nr:cupin domain-containing protein [Pseudonocardia broussonetiae]QJY48588.1 cupin domain-containing protein [Pseudonocardia broussonetiae]
MHHRPIVLHQDDIAPESWDDPVRGTLSFRTLLGGAATPTGQFTAGVADLPPGGWLGAHAHDQAEVYFVLEGELLLRLDDTDHRLRAGSTVFLPGGATHGVTNTGDAVARVFYVLAAGSFEEVGYRFGT